jgi:hypothetical protein
MQVLEGNGHERGRKSLTIFVRVDDSSALIQVQAIGLSDAANYRAPRYLFTKDISMFTL